MAAGNLTEDQIHEMRWVVNPNTGRPTKLDHTLELEADYQVWLSSECAHHDIQILKCPLKNGSEQIRKQCIDCGQSFGTPIKRSLIANLSDLRLGSIDRRYEYDRERRNSLQEIKAKHFLRQARPGWGSTEYSQYLKSDAWIKKRKAVMKRADGVCEGCGLTDAAVVHHHHYDNIYNEWLWDLVALCHECHRRCHPEHRAGDD